MVSVEGDGDPANTSPGSKRGYFGSEPFMSLRGFELAAFRFGMELSYVEKYCSVAVVEL